MPVIAVCPPLQKFSELVSDSRLLSRLQVKRELLRSGLSEHSPELEPSAPRPLCAARPRRPRLGRPPADGLPRLFGGSLEEYLELSGQKIPLIVRSCVRVVNLYGLHHQGIFRVSGSQVRGRVGLGGGLVEPLVRNAVKGC